MCIHSGRRRCRSLSLGCMKRSLIAMATGWLTGYQSSQEMAPASDTAAAQPPNQQDQPNRVCTSLSWDSGYNECATEVACSPTGRRLAGTMRMPSVVVSDCSDDPNENGDTIVLTNGYYRLNELPSPTLSSHSSCGHDTVQEMDPMDHHAASWTWASSYRSSGFLILPGQVDDDATMSSSLLSVRRLSDCSSCSSLATLDMEPCCPCNGQGTSFQNDEDQLDYDLTQDVVEDTPKEDARLPTEEITSSTKVRVLIFGFFFFVDFLATEFACRAFYFE